MNSNTNQANETRRTSTRLTQTEDTSTLSGQAVDAHRSSMGLDQAVDTRRSSTGLELAFQVENSTPPEPKKRRIELPEGSSSKRPRQQKYLANLKALLDTVKEYEAQDKPLTPELQRAKDVQTKKRQQKADYMRRKRAQQSLQTEDQTSSQNYTAQNIIFNANVLAPSTSSFSNLRPPQPHDQIINLEEPSINPPSPPIPSRPYRFQPPHPFDGRIDPALNDPTTPIPSSSNVEMDNPALNAEPPHTTQTVQEPNVPHRPRPRPRSLVPIPSPPANVEKAVQTFHEHCTAESRSVVDKAIGPGTSLMFTLRVSKILTTDSPILDKDFVAIDDGISEENIIDLTTYEGFELPRESPTIHWPGGKFITVAPFIADPKNSKTNLLSKVSVSIFINVGIA